jgi:hypothetical protein
MINISDLVPLEHEEQAKKALIMGIHNKLQLYIIDREKSSPRLLSAGELEEIRTAPPDDRKISITLWRHPSGISPYQNVGYLDLWVEKSKYDVIFKPVDEQVKEEKGLDIPKSVHEIDLSKSPYWNTFELQTKTAIFKYPEWETNCKKNKRRITKESIKNWVKENIDKDIRKAEIIKNTLSDIFQ